MVPKTYGGKIHEVSYRCDGSHRSVPNLRGFENWTILTRKEKKRELHFAMAITVGGPCVAWVQIEKIDSVCICPSQCQLGRSVRLEFRPFVRRQREAKEGRRVSVLCCLGKWARTSRRQNGRIREDEKRDEPREGGEKKKKGREPAGTGSDLYMY